MSKLRVRYLSLWTVDANQEEPLWCKVQACMVGGARYLGTYRNQPLSLPRKMPVRQAIEIVAKVLGLGTAEVSLAVGGLPLLACSRKDHDLVLLLPEGPKKFSVYGLQGRSSVLIDVGLVSEQFTECVQLYKTAPGVDINHSITSLFPMALIVVATMAKIILLGASLVAGLMLLQTGSFTNKLTLFVSSVVALLLAIGSDRFITSIAQQNLSLVRLWAEYQVYSRIFSLDLERYAQTSSAQIERVLLWLKCGIDRYYSRTPRLIAALALVLANIIALCCFHTFAGLGLVLLPVFALWLGRTLGQQSQGFAKTALVLQDQLDQALAALQYSFAMAVGLHAQGPLIERLNNISQDLRAQAKDIAQRRMWARFSKLMAPLVLLGFIAIWSAPWPPVLTSFLVIDAMALGWALGELVYFGMRPLAPVVRRQVIAELNRWASKPSQHVQPVNISGAIELHDVSFAYPESGALVIKNANLKLEAQELYVVQGPSGSGKSTLLKLLMAQEIAQDGQVVFDGQDVRSLEPDLLRQHFGVVNQDSSPFAGSIRANILCGRDVPARDLEHLLYSHEIFDLLLDLPMGLECYLFDRAPNISRLQAVVLLLARALVHQPKILFMDEIFKGIGPDQQAIIAAYVQSLPLTRVLVAHDVPMGLRPAWVFDHTQWHQVA